MIGEQYKPIIKEQNCGNMAFKSDVMQMVISRSNIVRNSELTCKQKGYTSTQLQDGHEAQIQNGGHQENMRY